MTHNFHPSILREYDVRGIVGDTLTDADAARSAAAMARWRLPRGRKRIAVGRDGRTHSPEMEAALVDGLTASGLDVVRIGMGPSPMLYFATATAGRRRRHPGHRQPQPGRLQRLQDAAQGPLGLRRGDPGAWTALPRRPTGAQGEGQVEDADVLEAYVDRLVEDFQGGEFRVGWDAGNGAAGPALEKLIERLPGEHHAIFTEVDGSFPNHHPDPTVEANLADLKALVAEQQLDFGIAFDGDGDRIGAVDGRGPRDLGRPVADRSSPRRCSPSNPAQRSSPTSRRARCCSTASPRLGGTPLMWKTGHSLIKSKMKETGAPLAGEMSGHIFFKHRWYGFDDALYAAVRLIEAVAASGKSLTELMDAMPRSVATPELRFAVDAARKFAVVDEVRDAPVRRRRRGRRHRRRPRQHGRRLVAAARLEHAGRAGRAGRGEG